MSQSTDQPASSTAGRVGIDPVDLASHGDRPVGSTVKPSGGSKRSVLESSAPDPSAVLGPAGHRRRRIGRPTTLSALVFARDRGIIMLWLAFIVIFSIWASPVFATVTNASLIAGSAAITAIFAAAVAFGVLSGSLDLSVPGTAAFAGVIGAKLLGVQVPVIVVLAAILLIGAAVGCVNGVLALTGLNALVVTIGMLSVLTGAAAVISGGLPVTIPEGTLDFIGSDSKLRIPAPAWVAIIVFALGSLFLTQCRGGVRLLAVGGNAEAVRRAGVNANRYKVLGFALSGVCAATGGIVTAAVVTQASPAASTATLFDALTAVALSGMAFTGGRGSFPRVLVGALIIGTIASGLVIKNIQPYWTTVASGALLILALAADRVLSKAVAARAVASSTASTHA